MGSWHRMDLRASSYAMGLMADTTPAWREVYSRVLDELVYRFTGYWAAKRSGSGNLNRGISGIAA